MVECNNICYSSEAVCKHCKENYIVSEDMYKAKRRKSGQYVVGYLVRYKNNNKIAGILNKSTGFRELAWIDEGTVSVYF